MSKKSNFQTLKLDEQIYPLVFTNIVPFLHSNTKVFLNLELVGSLILVLDTNLYRDEGFYVCSFKDKVGIVPIKILRQAFKRTY